jgi:hypothetical protein
MTKAEAMPGSPGRPRPNGDFRMPRALLQLARNSYLMAPLLKRNHLQTFLFKKSSLSSIKIFPSFRLVWPQASNRLPIHNRYSSLQDSSRLTTNTTQTFSGNPCFDYLAFQASFLRAEYSDNCRSFSKLGSASPGILALATPQPVI